MIQITDHLARLRARVERALESAGRSGDDVTIVAVSKLHSAVAIREAYGAGQRHFGESYAQEAAPKQQALAGCPITWHFIGGIQANKTRLIAERFDWVHSLDRLRVAERLSEQRPESKPPLPVLIQVNSAREPQKAGVSLAEVERLATSVIQLPGLALRGLMTIPPAGSPDIHRARHFSAIHELGMRLAAQGMPIDTFSMGMTDDFELAIACGSNCIRIGTAIFGPRKARPASN